MVRKSARYVAGLVIPLVLVAFAAPAIAQSIKTEDDIEAGGRLVSKVAPGTPPLSVESQAKVANLNADTVDGKHAATFALVVELLAAIESLNNPDPPCVDSTQRFVNCGNGTVTDTVTGLIYLENADCFPVQNWPTANASVAALKSGQCGLSDGSRAGDWRLPTVEEWEEILRAGCPNAPKIVGNGSDSTNSCYSDSGWATDVQSSSHWSSTSNLYDASTACYVGFYTGGTNIVNDKATAEYQIWPVRDGH